MLKAEFMKLWLFRFSIIKLSFQLRYYRMNENSKCDISFIYADTWHATQNKSFRSDLWTSRTLKMCQYQNPWVTKPVLCPFLNNWKYSKIVVRVFRAQLGLKNPSVTVSVGQRHRRAMQVSSKSSMSNTSFHNFDLRSNGLRCDFSTNKLKSI